MLITTSWVEKVKELIHLKAISPIWGDKPAWYFWLSHIQGAYLLELDETDDEKWENEGLASGIFKVKHYPYPHKAGFYDFSFEEQAFVQSDFFDHTHTPKFEKKDRIPDSLFNIAALELTIDPAENLALFSMEALDSMQIHYGREIYQTYPDIHKTKQYEAGEKARDVPGFDLGYQLFSSLLSLYSFYSKIKPVRTVLTRSPGFKHICNSPQDYQCIDTDDINLYVLCGLFSDTSGKNIANGEKLIGQRFEDVDEEIVFDQQFSNGHLPHNYISPVVEPALDEKWWSLAEADYKSDLGSTCGCNDCQH